MSTDNYIQQRLEIERRHDPDTRLPTDKDEEGRTAFGGYSGFHCPTIRDREKFREPPTYDWGVPQSLKDWMFIRQQRKMDLEDCLAKGEYASHLHIYCSWCGTQITNSWLFGNDRICESCVNLVVRDYMPRYLVECWPVPAPRPAPRPELDYTIRESMESLNKHFGETTQKWLRSLWRINHPERTEEEQTTFLEAARPYWSTIF